MRVVEAALQRGALVGLAVAAVGVVGDESTLAVKGLSSACTLPAKGRATRRAASVAVIGVLVMICSLEGVSECLASIPKQIVCQLFESLAWRGLPAVRGALLLRRAMKSRTELGADAPSWCIVRRAGGDSGAEALAC